MIKALVAALLVFGVLAAAAAPARATGTLTIQQRNGNVKVYKNTLVRVKDYAMAIVSADGNGMLVIGKASCTKVGELLRCLPYDATLDQYGDTYHIPLTTGTVWLNPTAQAQPLPYSSALLQPRGVLMSVHTKAGTYVSLSGTVDEVVK